MKQERAGIYFGIDISDKYTMISMYQLHMAEPQTISTIVGSENYQIPTYLSKKKGISQWYLGREARQRVQMGEAIGVDGLLEKFNSGAGKELDNDRILFSK